MKFSVRHADIIVGIFIILALAILVFVIFMLGSNQRWFARDNQYKTYFNSAAGISTNMPISYKGFTIGQVKKVGLTESDMVEVTFTIYEEYTSKVTEGSLVELQSSPIPGLGGGFIFHPGRGIELIPEDGIIPEINSPQARQFRERGLTEVSTSSDSISNIINQVNTLLETINISLAGSKGADELTLGQILLNIEQTTNGITTLADTLIDQVNPVISQINPVISQIYSIIAQVYLIFDQITPVLSNIETITGDIGSVTGMISDPSGTVMSILDSDGVLSTSLTEAIESIAGTINNLEKTTEFIPVQLPQISVLISQVNNVLRSAQDVLTALSNNPLLKGGIPGRTETGPGGTSPRNLDF